MQYTKDIQMIFDELDRIDYAISLIDEKLDKLEEDYNKLKGDK